MVLYSHDYDQQYKHIHLHMHAEHNDTMKTSDSLLEKYTSHFIWKGCVWEGVGDRTELQYIDPHSIGHNRVPFPFSWVAQPGAWGAHSDGFLYRILSPTGLVARLTDFLFSPSYIIVQPPFFLWASQLHSFNPSTVKVIILIFLDRMHLLFTQVHFLFWQPSWVVGQYTINGKAAGMEISGR